MEEKKSDVKDHLKVGRIFGPNGGEEICYREFQQYFRDAAEGENLDFCVLDIGSVERQMFTVPDLSSNILNMPPDEFVPHDSLDAEDWKKVVLKCSPWIELDEIDEEKRAAFENIFAHELVIAEKLGPKAFLISLQGVSSVNLSEILNRFFDRYSYRSLDIWIETEIEGSKPRTIKRKGQVIEQLMPVDDRVPQNEDIQTREILTVVNQSSLNNNVTKSFNTATDQIIGANPTIGAEFGHYYNMPADVHKQKQVVKSPSKRKRTDSGSDSVPKTEYDESRETRKKESVLNQFFVDRWTEFWTGLTMEAKRKTRLVITIPSDYSDGEGNKTSGVGGNRDILNQWLSHPVAAVHVPFHFFIGLMDSWERLSLLDQKRNGFGGFVETNKPNHPNSWVRALLQTKDAIRISPAEHRWAKSGEQITKVHGGLLRDFSLNDRLKYENRVNHLYRALCTAVTSFANIDHHRELRIVMMSNGIGKLVGKLLAELRKSLNCKILLIVVDDSEHVVDIIRGKVDLMDDLPKNISVECVHSDLRAFSLQKRHLADVVLVDMFCGFGDEEMVTELTHRARNSLLKNNGVLIPQSFSTFLIPVQSEKLKLAAMLRMDQNGITENEHDIANCMYSVAPGGARLLADQQLVKFGEGGDASNQQSLDVEWKNLASKGLLTGFLGFVQYYILLKQGIFSNLPVKIDKQGHLLETYPLFIPLASSIELHENMTLHLSMKRCSRGNKMQYEWTSRCNGAAEMNQSRIVKLPFVPKGKRTVSYPECIHGIPAMPALSLQSNILPNDNTTTHPDANSLDATVATFYEPTILLAAEEELDDGKSGADEEAGDEELLFYAVQPDSESSDVDEQLHSSVDKTDQITEDSGQLKTDEEWKCILSRLEEYFAALHVVHISRASKGRRNVDSNNNKQQQQQPPVVVNKSISDEVEKTPASDVEKTVSKTIVDAGNESLLIDDVNNTEVLYDSLEVERAEKHIMNNAKFIVQCLHALKRAKKDENKAVKKIYSRASGRIATMERIADAYHSMLNAGRPWLPLGSIFPDAEVRDYVEKEAKKVAVVLEADEVIKEVDNSAKKVNEEDWDKVVNELAKEVDNSAKKPDEEDGDKVENEPAKEADNSAKKPDEEDCNKVENEPAKEMDNSAKKPDEEDRENAENVPEKVPADLDDSILNAIPNNRHDHLMVVNSDKKAMRTASKIADRRHLNDVKQRMDTSSPGPKPVGSPIHPKAPMSENRKSSKSYHRSGSGSGGKRGSDKHFSPNKNSSKSRKI